MKHDSEQKKGIQSSEIMRYNLGEVMLSKLLRRQLTNAHVYEK